MGGSNTGSAEPEIRPTTYEELTISVLCYRASFLVERKREKRTRCIEVHRYCNTILSQINFVA